jgi:hypothetical protein
LRADLVHRTIARDAADAMEQVHRIPKTLHRKPNGSLALNMTAISPFTGLTEPRTSSPELKVAGPAD